MPMREYLQSSRTQVERRCDLLRRKTLRLHVSDHRNFEIVVSSWRTAGAMRRLDLRQGLQSARRNFALDDFFEELSDWNLARARGSLSFAEQ